MMKLNFQSSQVKLHYIFRVDKVFYNAVNKCVNPAKEHISYSCF